MIKRDINHPSIILWSVGNEIPVNEKACLNFIEILLKYARLLDDSRLITCTIEFWNSLVTPKRLLKQVDVLCNNQYIGWYYLSVNNLSILLDCLNIVSKKPIFVTEFGAGAKYKHHDLSKIPAKYSEERQDIILSHSIKVMNSKEYIKGWFIWIYRDFRSHMRLNEYQQGYNRKGIVSEKTQKKMIAKKIPLIINTKIDQMRRHKIRALIFYIILFPVIKFNAIVISILLSKFSNPADSYYTRTEIQ